MKISVVALNTKGWKTIVSHIAGSKEVEVCYFYKCGVFKWKNAGMIIIKEDGTKNYMTGYNMDLKTGELLNILERSGMVLEDVNFSNATPLIIYSKPIRIIKGILSKPAVLAKILGKFLYYFIYYIIKGAPEKTSSKTAEK